MFIKCWLLGHKWKYKAYSYRSIILAHLSALAGCCVECERCGKMSCDIPSVAIDETGNTHICDCSYDRS
jgi:hypothetical protein